MSARTFVVAAGAVLATIALAAGVSTAKTGASPRISAHSPPVTGAPQTMPGTDPKIQHWFLLIEKATVSFNNDLLKAEEDIKAGVDTGNCSALLTATNVIKSRLADLTAIPNGGSAIAAAYLAPIDEFGQAATDCKAGDFPGARTVLGDTSHGAIADYGRAQDSVDEILDAGA